MTKPMGIARFWKNNELVYLTLQNESFKVNVEEELFEDWLWIELQRHTLAYPRYRYKFRIKGKFTTLMDIFIEEIYDAKGQVRI